jgi:hypothetical protein
MAEAVKEFTYYGQACHYFLVDMLGRINQTIKSWDNKYDYIRLELPNYNSTVSITLADLSEKKYHLHKILYGPVEEVDGKDDFTKRADSEEFWMKQWNLPCSPFRLIQNTFAEFGIFIFDHTYKGSTPFIHIYRYMPDYQLIEKLPWHNYHTITGFQPMEKLSNPEIIKASLRANMALQKIIMKNSQKVIPAKFKIVDYVINTPEKKKEVGNFTKKKNVIRKTK